MLLHVPWFWFRTFQICEQKFALFKLLHLNQQYSSSCSILMQNEGTFITANSLSLINFILLWNWHDLCQWASISRWKNNSIICISKFVYIGTPFWHPTTPKIDHPQMKSLKTDKMPTDIINRADNILFYTFPTTLRKIPFNPSKAAALSPFKFKKTPFTSQKQIFSSFVTTVGICLNNKKILECLSL